MRILFVKNSFGLIILDNCYIDQKNLVCQIHKNKLEEILSSNKERFMIASYSSTGILGLYNILEILVTYNNITKEDINVGITRLLGKTYGERDLITYETNITNISNTVSNFIYLELNNSKLECFFKKSEITNLLLLCGGVEEGKHSLGEITKEISVIDTTLKYNFFIQPGKNTEEYIVRGQGSPLILEAPSELNFNLNDSFTIDFVTPIPDIIKIKINPDSNALDCYNNNIIKKCIVPKSHFEGKNSSYYYIMHSNSLDDWIVSYELSPIQIILPENGKN